MDTEALCVIDQLPDDTIWCATKHGRLARFGNAEEGSSVLDTVGEVSVDILPVRLLSPRRPLGFDVCHINVSPSEKFLLLAGYSESRPHLAAVFLSSGSERVLHSETYNYVSCQGDFIFSRPGMIIRQVSWWPGNDPQFFVVLSGNCLAVYDVHSVSVPYATYRLLFMPMKPSLGDDRNSGIPMAFAFLADPRGWETFTLVVLRDDGSLFAICPIHVPGVAVSKTTALSLLDASMDTDIDQWHRYVMSRTQLAQSNKDAPIMTRSLPLIWKHTPAMQGPLKSGKEINSRRFEGLQSLGHGRILIGSAIGQMLILSLPDIKPMFDCQDMRRGAPHVFVLQDCHAATPSGDMLCLSEINTCRPSKTLHLVNFSVIAMCVCIMDDHLMIMNWSCPEAPISVTYKTSKPRLGCVKRGRMIVSVHETSSLQLRCGLVKDDEYGNFRSLLQSENAEFEEGTDDIMKEEESLDTISCLRDTLRRMYGTLADANNEHEQKTELLMPHMETLIQRLNALSNATSSDDRNQKLICHYQGMLQKLSQAFKEMSVSDGSAGDMVNAVKDCLDVLNSRDQYRSE